MRWILVDVYGRPWMAPRAGFEVARKLLSSHAARTMGEQKTPSYTPRADALDSRLLRGCLQRRCEVAA